MSNLFPDIIIDSVTNITNTMLDNLGIKGLIIDIDNTLTFHNSPQISLDVLNWVKDIKGSYGCILLSNNNEKRVKPFAELLGLDYIANGAKPLPSKGIARAAKLLNLKPEEIAVVGDQIFTDVLGGNWFGATTIRVEPIQSEGGFFFDIKRKLEKRVMKSYHKKREKKL